MNLSDIASILPLPEHVLNFTQDENTIFQYQHSHVPHHHEDFHHGNGMPALADEIPQQFQTLPVFHPNHVNTDDLLKIPVITNTLVVDFDSSDESSSSSSSEEDVDKKPSSGSSLSKVLALGENPLAASSSH